MRPIMPIMTFALACLLLLAPVSSAGDVTRDTTITISAAGEMRWEIDWDLEDADYRALQKAFPDPAVLLRDLRGDRTDFEVDAGRTRADYDDRRTALRFDLVQVGWAENLGGGRWRVAIETGFEYMNLDAARRTAFFFESGVEDGAHYRGRVRYVLPEAASQARWDEGRRRLEYRLPAPSSEGRPRLSMDLRVKDRLLATIYKAYGLGTEFHAQWVAKAILVNDGDGTMHDLRVRYRVGDDRYGEWSGWEKFAEVVPGQTVVSVYYPILRDEVGRIRTTTPVDVRWEIRFEDAAGEVEEDAGRERTRIHGAGEFLFSNLPAAEQAGFADAFNNAPLLAAWVSRNEPAISDFAAIAAKLTGGVGAGTDDESALATLRAAYELMLVAGITYQHPAALTDRSVSFDPAGIQNVKFPRDTLRSKSGTCIDLAILYASIVNAIGLEPYLILVPGHCFPAVALPGGGLVGVETTGVGGGLEGNFLGFEKVVQIGKKSIEEAQASGEFFLVDVRALWTTGVANPELEPLPADILQRWGLDADRILEKLRRIQAGSGRAAPAPAERDTASLAPPTSSGDPLAGLDVQQTAEIYDRLVAAGDFAGARRAAVRLGQLCRDDAESLNNLAWLFLTTDATAGRFDDVALEMAARASELTGHENPSILDTLALAAYRNGLVEDAIKIQTAAIQRARAAGFDRSEIAEMEERLRLFRR